MHDTPPSLAILDVGHGNCAVLIDTSGVVVIDTGRGSALLEYLRAEDVTTIEAVLLSHADIDHIGGLIAILSCNKFHVKRVRLNTDAEKDTAAWDDLLFLLERRSGSESLDFEPSLTSNDTGKFDQGDTEVEIVAPSPYLASKGPGGKDSLGRTVLTNSISAVIRLKMGGHPVALLAGDLDKVGLDDIVRTRREMAAPILVFPHHGGESGPSGTGLFAKALLACVAPRTVLFSHGRKKYNNPKPHIVSAIREVAPDARIVCTQLSKNCAESLMPTQFAHLNGAFADGRRRGECCGGTIFVAFDEPGVVTPSRGAHELFIDLAAPTALCRRTPLS